MNHRRHRLRIDTEHHRIEGTVQLPDAGFRSRTTDFFNAREGQFIAVVDATLVPLRGGEPEHHPYIAVSARHIVLVAEIESLDGADQQRPAATRAAGA